MRRGVDIVVLNHVSPNRLKQFLKSLYETGSSRPFDLWVASVEPRTDHSFVIEGSRGHHVIHRDHGIGSIVNSTVFLGFRENIVIFDANIELTPGCLDICLDILDSDPKIGVVGPRLVTSTGLVVSAGFFGDPPEERSGSSSDSSETRDIRDASHVSGYAYFIKRKVWWEAFSFMRNLNIWTKLRQENLIPVDVPDGAFLPTYRDYEALSCSLLVRKMDYRCVYFGSSEVVYHGSTTKPNTDRDLSGSKIVFEEFKQAAQLN
jgi:hypothetical protein